MIWHRIQQLRVFLNLRYQSGQGLSEQDLNTVGGTLDGIENDVKELEETTGNIVQIAPYITRREEKNYCEQQGLKDPPPPRDPSGPGDAA